MPWLSSIERLAKEEGLREGLLKVIRWEIESEFGTRGRRLLAKAKALKEVEQLEAFGRCLMSADTLDEARRLLS